MALGPKFYTLLKVVPVSLKNKFRLNPVETFCKMDEKLTSDLFWPYSVKKDLQISPLGVHIPHTSKSSFSELKNKFHVNSMETFRKIEEKLIFT